MIESGPSAEVRNAMGRCRSPGAAVAVARDGEVVWREEAGIANAATGAETVAETAFLWFSMTKIATATAVMQLVESGTVELDGPAARSVPDLTGLDPRITVRQLLNHSSGLPNPPPLKWIHPADQPGPDPREMVVRLLARRGRPRFEPGARSSYSNVGYLVLGEVIAAASGLAYTEYVVERVLRPIGAISTGFAFAEPSGPLRAAGHHPARDPLLPALRLMIPRGTLDGRAGRWRLFNPFYLDGSAYGGLVGPAEEAALLAAAHGNGGLVNGTRLLGAESVAEMQRIVTAGRRFDLGLGWFRPHGDSRRGATWVEHLGGGGGYGTVMRLYPDRGIAAVAMANVSSSRFQYQPILDSIEAHHRGTTPPNAS